MEIGKLENQFFFTLNHFRKENQLARFSQKKTHSTIIDKVVICSQEDPL
jgi:hypothetical protein